MRLCRYRYQDQNGIGFYDEKYITPIQAAAASYRVAIHEAAEIPSSDNILDFLPHGPAASAAEQNQTPIY